MIAKGRMLVLVLVGLSLAACSFQFAIGKTVNQTVETDPLLALAAVLIAGLLFMLGMALLAGGGGFGPDR